MPNKRIVITGVGALSPNGVGRENYFAALKEGRSGVRTITQFDASSLPSRVAGEVDFDPTLERYARVDRQGVVTLHRVADASEIVHFEDLGPAEALARLEFSPDGQFLALARYDHRFQVWKLAGPEPVVLMPEQLSTMAPVFSRRPISVYGMLIRPGAAGGNHRLERCP